MAHWQGFKKSVRAFKLSIGWEGTYEHFILSSRELTSAALQYYIELGLIQLRNIYSLDIFL